MICDKCLTGTHIKLKYLAGQFICGSCYYGHRSTAPSTPGITEKVKVGDMWVTKNRVNELERRVILPTHDPEGGYFVGRRMENGRIAEKEPDYRG